jgi:hypothetical protein
LLQAAHANPVPRRATITGGGGNGRCTIEVIVDGSAEVEVSGDSGLLTTVSGQTSAWRRFQCNTPLPRHPADFRLSKLSGRGTVRLTQDPRNTGGRAVIHIGDPQAGRGNYTFDLQWQRNRGVWPPGPPMPVPGPGAFPMARVVRMCQDSVTDRLNQDGYSYITFERTTPDDNPGRHDWVTGTAKATRRFETRWFSFSCSVDFRAGIVRSVDVSRN